MMRLLACAACALVLGACSAEAPTRELGAGALVVSVDDAGQLRGRLAAGAGFALEDAPADVIFVGGRPVTDFTADDDGAVPEAVDDDLGLGTRIVLRGEAALDGGGRLAKQVALTRYDAFPDAVVSRVTYENAGDVDVRIDSVYLQQYRLRATEAAPGAAPAFWSFQAASYGSRPDWVLPLRAGYARYNDQGMNASDYGGGVPVVDVWTPAGGLAVGHLSTEPEVVALPVRMEDARTAHVQLVDARPRTLRPGERVETLPTFVQAHEGDFFAPLADYARMMAARGVEMPTFPETSYEPIWCAWGYGRGFDTEDVVGTIPKAKSLGLEWVVLDDGWQVAEGDWVPVAERFPGGEDDMIAFVDRIHAEGLKAKLWWVPLAADPGSRLAEEHPDWFVLDAEGERQRISWWDAHYLCPAVPEVREHVRALARRFLGTWGYDGLKVDGQNLNGVARCYNPAHGHEDPEASVRALPLYFEALYDEARAVKPDAVVELCPCGAAHSFYLMPYNNQPVASDPTSSWQIRTKGKTFKALMGPSTPYYGDHVELSDDGTDFASSFGVGAVLGTKFTWAPPEVRASARWQAQDYRDRNFLTEDREELWRHWFDLYRRYELPRGTYRGDLYDVGFDRPEAHAIEKDGALYYAFYADRWDGPLALRGLEAGTAYAVRDYVDGRALGAVEGPDGRLEAAFEGYLLLEARPEEPES